MDPLSAWARDQLGEMEREREGYVHQPGTLAPLGRVTVTAQLRRREPVDEGFVSIASVRQIARDRVIQRQQQPGRIEGDDFYNDYLERARALIDRVADIAIDDMNREMEVFMHGFRGLQPPVFDYYEGQGRMGVLQRIDAEVEEFLAHKPARKVPVENDAVCMD